MNFIMPPTPTIILGDSRRMSELKDESVHLVVTSPPYWQLKDYGSGSQIGFNDSYEDYINNLNLVWKECYRVLHKGCRLCVNIGDQFARSVYYGRYKIIPIREIFGLINEKRSISWEDVKKDFERFMNAETFSERIALIKDKYPETKPYDEDRWLNEALKFTRDASEIPEEDPLTNIPKPTRPRFVDISVRDINTHWFRFQNAAKKQLALVLNMVDAL